MHFLIQLMALGTLALDVAIVVAFYMLFSVQRRSRLVSFAQDYGLTLVALFSILAVGGTLLLQYADNLAPCLFCWWQRVFMYPIAVISIVAFIKNQKFSAIADYVSVLSIFGALIALYQHLLQVLPSGSLIPCDAADECAVRSIFEFGFVTLPWMAFTVFVALILVAILGRCDAGLARSPTNS